ncbi:Hypothetical Protein FCC1311_017412 [Hondaea fermentalgiana]|uniref:Uncharacterized protein n=1 Tax=Hondaea fermentalgiana TaxID=2315210 RepID=A0A2R5G3D1_9STRA|nr:Hypothetical Protein FCC1311_017412 [Hondaea fermentalgiana]|eukprot:GBG25522.1 Hypothetical Protein FCC1311_017412 [Hondaea fermentalgiana]
MISSPDVDVDVSSPNVDVDVSSPNVGIEVSARECYDNIDKFWRSCGSFHACGFADTPSARVASQIHGSTSLHLDIITD